jgi:hypothetical protein
MGKFTSMLNQPAQNFLKQLKDGYDDAPLHECTHQDCVCVYFHAKLVDQGGHVLGVF